MTPVIPNDAFLVFLWILVAGFGAAIALLFGKIFPPKK